MVAERPKGSLTFACACDAVWQGYCTADSGARLPAVLFTPNAVVEIDLA